jgi:RNA polymerase sigma-70 factor (ECF subfamily)
MKELLNAWNFESGQLPYRDQLLRTAIRLTRSVEESEDLLQETYLKAFKYYDRFEEGTNLKAWLFRILKNTFINAYRKKKNRPQNVPIDDLEEVLESIRIPDQGAPAATAEEVLVDGELDHEVRDALLGLAHEYKMAVLLVDLQGMSYQEAADIMEVPLGTVMSRLYRGRKKLEAALLGYGKRQGYLNKTPRRFRDHEAQRALCEG